MKHRTTHFLTTLAAVATAGTMTAAPASADEDFVGPNGRISATCAGDQIASGKVYDSTGSAHPTVRWRLYFSAASGGTKCLQVSDGSAGSHQMSAMIRPADQFHDGAKKVGVVQSVTSAVSVTGVAGDCIGLTAELTDDGRFYQRNIASTACA